MARQEDIVMLRHLFNSIGEWVEWTRFSQPQINIVSALAPYREAGYAIDTSLQGLRLNPPGDIWCAEEILARLPPSEWDVLILESTHSTNDVARDAARRSAAPGFVVAANTQTAGRGRAGRTWHSPPHEGLYFSVLLKPDFEAQLAGRLAILAAVALADAIKNVCLLRPKIKWPNDLLIEGKKVGGILVETELSEGKIEFAIVGIGININSQSLPGELEDRATSLALATGRKHRRADMLVAILEMLAIRQKQEFHLVRADWESRCDIVSRQVELATPNGKEAGTVLGLNEDGSLVLQTADGTTRTVR